MSTNPLRIRIELTAGKQLGALMNEMREWLDNQKIQALEFRPAPKPVEGFDLAFGSTEEAERFRERFGGLSA